VLEIIYKYYFSSGYFCLGRQRWEIGRARRRLRATKTLKRKCEAQRKFPAVSARNMSEYFTTKTFPAIFLRS
jgi:hypothetical protein